MIEDIARKPAVRSTATVPVYAFESAVAMLFSFVSA
jgi:hypothetical protein